MIDADSKKLDLPMNLIKLVSGVYCAAIYNNILENCDELVKGLKVEVKEVPNI